MIKKILTALCVVIMTLCVTGVSYAGAWSYTEPVDLDPYTDSTTGLKIYKDDGIQTFNIDKNGKWEVYTRQGCQLTRLNSETIPKMDITYVEQYNYYIYRPSSEAQYINIKGGVTEVYVKSRLIPDHICKYDATVTEPTCLYEGYTTYTCSVCNVEWVDDYTQPLGHDYVNGVCSRCGKIDTTYSEYVLGKVYDPNTGDVTPVGWLVIIAIGALVIAALVFFIGRKKK